MSPFSAIITPQSVSFTTPSGKVHNIDSSHKKWDEIVQTIKFLNETLKIEATTFGEQEPGCYSSAELHDKLRALVDEAKVIEAAGVGKVTVVSGVVYYEDEAVHSAITERIIWGLGDGYDMDPYMAFLDNAMDNPSSRSVSEMYSFMERNNMGITADGYVLGYKKVSETFKDLYTGTIDNSPGQVVEMKRNKVNDDARQTCSHGLHFCSMSYLPCYGTSRGNKIVIVKVNPRDIVSVPIDYDCAKVRCCRYEVVSEYTGSDVEDLLGTKAVWSDDDFDDWNDDNDEDVFKIDDAGEYEDECVICGEDSHECSCYYCSNCGNDPCVCVVPQENADDALNEHEHGAALSVEGEDMRHIMDTVEAPPSSPEAADIRKFIDAVEEPAVAVEETPETVEEGVSESTVTDKARELLQQLYEELNKKK